jgi:hypothetical protein
VGTFQVVKKYICALRLLIDGYVLNLITIFAGNATLFAEADRARHHNLMSIRGYSLLHCLMKLMFI